MIESIVLKNTVLGTRININKSRGEYWLDSVDWGVVEGTNHTFKYIDQIGESVYNTTLEPRQIQIIGWVAAWDSLAVTRMKRVLNSFINPQHLMEAYANGMKIKFYPRTSVKYGITHQENNELICKFLITGYCPYPLFTDENSRSVSVAHTERRLVFPLVIPEDQGLIMGLLQPTLIAEISNPGDFEVGYSIELKANGTVINPILTDIDSQEFISIKKTLTAGEVIRIDTREGQRQIRGGLENPSSNYFQYRTFDSSWLSLKRGMNYLRYDAEEGVDSLEVSILFDPAYLEVDT